MPRCVNCGHQKDRHNDGNCPGSETSHYADMEIPAGLKCRDCQHFENFCSRYIGPSIADNTNCDWYPIRFMPKLPERQNG